MCSGETRQTDEHAALETISLRADRWAPRRARRFIRGVAEDSPTELVERAELAVSELVSNAVIHGSRPGATLKLAAGIHQNRLRVEVSDQGAGARDVVPGRGGYGLEIAERLSDVMVVHRGPKWRVAAEFVPRSDPS